MPPPDGPLDLGLATLRWPAVALLGTMAAAGLVLSRGGPAPPVAWRRWAVSPIAVLAVALAVRALLSLTVDGGLYDVFHAYRLVGHQLRGGGDVFTGDSLGLANYPPVVYWWWAAADAVPEAHPHVFAALVRAPFWVADAALAVVLLRVVAPPRAAAAAWLYALSPVAAAVPTLHGQFEPWVLLPLVAAIALLPARPLTAGLLLGLAIAVKPWPAFFLVPLLATLPVGAWVRLLGGVAVAPLLAFAVEAAVHPAGVPEGLRRVLTYQAHRQGFGISWLLPDSLGATPVNVLNAVAGTVAVVAGVVAARRGLARAEVVALSMLVLLTLSPTVSDQYLVWPLPMLLVAGRLRTAAALGAALLPADVAVNLWTSQEGTATPAPLFALATLATGAAAVAVALAPAGRRGAAAGAGPAVP